MTISFISLLMPTFDHFVALLPVKIAFPLKCTLQFLILFIVLQTVISLMPTFAALVAGSCQIF
jgi:hypothetical protein